MAHDNSRSSRTRRALRVGATIATALFAPVVLGVDAADAQTTRSNSPAHLDARPRAARTGGAHGGGLHAIGLASQRGRDGWLYVPTSYRPGTPMPLLVALHGAGGSGRSMLAAIVPVAEARGVIVLAPDSRESTWDAIRDDFGPDVRFIDQALDRVFDTYNVDPSRLAIAGFSDGASYALSLGLANGSLFGCVMAFSPGFVATAPPEGSPRIFITHGTRDAVLSIDACSRRIKPRLEQAGYRVTYREFDGPHTARAADVRDALTFWLDRTS
jgi:phospholipase/carboxylesterase